MMKTNHHDVVHIVNDGEATHATQKGCMPRETTAGSNRDRPTKFAADFESWLHSLDTDSFIGVEEHLEQLLVEAQLEEDEREWTRELEAAENSPAFLRLMNAWKTENPPRQHPRKALTTKQVCTTYREGHEVCDDPQCRKLHIFPQKDCKNDSYLQCGICSNWGKCRSRHPWNTKQWGDKTEAFEKYKERNKKGAMQAAAEKKTTAKIKPIPKETKQMKANKMLRMIASQ
jgi:hypothetical protein